MKKWISVILLAVLVSGCTTFSITAPDGTKVTGTSVGTDFDNVKGQWPSGGGFEIVGAKTQVEAVVEAFKAGLEAGMAVTP